MGSRWHFGDGIVILHIGDLVAKGFESSVHDNCLFIKKVKDHFKAQFVCG